MQVCSLVVFSCSSSSAAVSSEVAIALACSVAGLSGWDSFDAKASASSMEANGVGVLVDDGDKDVHSEDVEDDGDVVADIVANSSDAFSTHSQVSHLIFPLCTTHSAASSCSCIAFNNHC